MQVEAITRISSSLFQRDSSSDPSSVRVKTLFCNPVRELPSTVRISRGTVHLVTDPCVSGDSPLCKESDFWRCWCDECQRKDCDGAGQGVSLARFSTRLFVQGRRFSFGSSGGQSERGRTCRRRQEMPEEGGPSPGERQ